MCENIDRPTLYTNKKLLLLLLSLIIQLISRSMDLWNIYFISSLCSIDKLSFPPFRSSASSFSSQCLLLFLKASWSCVFFLTLFTFVICTSMASWKTQFLPRIWPTQLSFLRRIFRRNITNPIGFSRRIVYLFTSVLFSTIRSRIH